MRAQLARVDADEDLWNRPGLLVAPLASPLNRVGSEDERLAGEVPSRPLAGCAGCIEPSWCAQAPRSGATARLTQSRSMVRRWSCTLAGS